MGGKAEIYSLVADTNFIIYLFICSCDSLVINMIKIKVVYIFFNSIEFKLPG